MFLPMLATLGPFCGRRADFYGFLADARAEALADSLLRWGFSFRRREKNVQENDQALYLRIATNEEIA